MVNIYFISFKDAKGTVTNRKSQKRAGSKRSQTKSADPEINTNQAEKNKGIHCTYFAFFTCLIFKLKHNSNIYFFNY